MDHPTGTGRRHSDVSHDGTCRPAAACRLIVPTTPVLVDAGITAGADVVAAVAMGATACLVGPAYLCGLMAGGRRGVDRSLSIRTNEMVRTMALLGAPTVGDLAGRAVLRPPRG